MSGAEMSGDDGTLPILAVEGFKATIRLNRPKQHNRLEAADLAALERLLAGLEQRDDLRVLILTGTGRSFCSGYHIGSIGKAKAPGSQSASDGAFERVTDQVENFRLPTICALNGGVYGGATDLALACDFRIGVAGSQMFMPAARLGIHYYRGGLRRYVTRLGLGAAKKLFLTAQTIDADEMRRIGYLDEVVPAAELAARVAALAEQIGALAPLAVTGMKRALNQIAAGTLDLAALQAASAACMASADLQEGLAAFTEKRRPVFHGH